MFEIRNLVSDPSDLGHRAFEVSDPVTDDCLVRVDGVSPLSGESPGSCQVATAEVSGDESDYGGVVHYKDRMFFV